MAPEASSRPSSMAGVAAGTFICDREPLGWVFNVICIDRCPFSRGPNTTMKSRQARQLSALSCETQRFHRTGVVEVLMRCTLLTLVVLMAFASAPLSGRQAADRAWNFAVSGDSRNCGDVVMPAI